MKERWYYLVMILLLLFVQAFCDLSLPDYTSDIINVGIQQKGIEDGVPEKLREESADKLFLFMDQEDREQVQEDYTLTDGMYELKDISSEEREELNSILGVSGTDRNRPFRSFFQGSGSDKRTDGTGSGR